MMTRALTAMLLFGAGSAFAATTGEEKRFVVNPLGGSDFEVIRLQQMGPSELWCAAASYVEAQRGLSETTRIYIRTPLSPARTVAGRQGVVFTLNDAGLPAADPARLSITVSDAGAVLKSATARRYCRDAFTRSTK